MQGSPGTDMLGPQAGIPVPVRIQTQTGGGRVLPRAEDDMIQKTFIDKIPAKIVSETCGTAMQKTITVKVNAEMGLEDATQLINEINNAVKWLKQAKKNCEACDHYGDCLERDPINDSSVLGPRNWT